MIEKRKRISEGATLEEIQALLLKVTRQLRTMAPLRHVVRELDQTKALVELMMARSNGYFLLH